MDWGEITYKTHLMNISFQMKYGTVKDSQSRAIPMIKFFNLWMISVKGVNQKIKAPTLIKFSVICTTRPTIFNTMTVK